MKKEQIIKTISDEIIKNLLTCLPNKCNRGFTYDSHLLIKNTPVSFKYRIITNSPSGWNLNNPIYNPHPNIFKNIIRFYDLRIGDSLKGQGIFTGVLNRVENVCDKHLVIIMVSEFANQKLAYHLWKQRGYTLFINKDTRTNLNLLKKYLNDIRNKTLFEIIMRKGIPDEKAEYAVRFPQSEKAFRKIENAYRKALNQLNSGTFTKKVRNLDSL